MDKLIKLTIAAVLVMTIVPTHEASARKKAPQNINKASIVLEKVTACDDAYYAGLEQCNSDYEGGTRTQIENCKAGEKAKQNLCINDAHKSIQ